MTTIHFSANKNVSPNVQFSAKRKKLLFLLPGQVGSGNALGIFKALNPNGFKKAFGDRYEGDIQHAAQSLRNLKNPLTKFQNFIAIDVPLFAKRIFKRYI